MIVAAIAIALAVAPSATPPRLPPVEMCRGDAGFDAFRRDLTAAVAAKDVAAIQRLAASDIRSSFAEGEGGAICSSLARHGPFGEQAVGRSSRGCSSWRAPTQAAGGVPRLFPGVGRRPDP